MELAGSQCFRVSRFSDGGEGVSQCWPLREPGDSGQPVPTRQKLLKCSPEDTLPHLATELGSGTEQQGQPWGATYAPQLTVRRLEGTSSVVVAALAGRPELLPVMVTKK